MGNKRVQLRVVKQPIGDRLKVLEISLPEITFFIGTGFTDFVCGKCDAVLADSVKEGSLDPLVLKCNKCNSYNEVFENRIDKSYLSAG